MPACSYFVWKLLTVALKVTFDNLKCIKMNNCIVDDDECVIGVNIVNLQPAQHQCVLRCPVCYK